LFEVLVDVSVSFSVLLLLATFFLLFAGRGSPSLSSTGLLGSTYAFNENPVRSGAMNERRVNFDGSNTKRALFVLYPMDLAPLPL